MRIDKAQESRNPQAPRLRSREYRKGEAIRILNTQNRAIDALFDGYERIPGIVRVKLQEKSKMSKSGIKTRTVYISELRIING